MITVTFIYRNGPRRCGCVSTSAADCLATRFTYTAPERAAMEVEGGGCHCLVCHPVAVGSARGDVGAA